MIDYFILKCPVCGHEFNYEPEYIELDSREDNTLEVYLRCKNLKCSIVSIYEIERGK